jgi:hypothetical protein
VTADVNPSAFLGKSAPVEQARLEIRFWYSTGVDREYYRINWIEPERNLMLGFHQDGDHPELGPCHIQFDYGDEPVDRHGAEFLDSHPLSVLEDRLQQLPSALDAIRWKNEQPSLPTWQV